MSKAQNETKVTRVLVETVEQDANGNEVPGTMQVQSININSDTNADGCVTAMFFTDNAVKNILAPFYTSGEHKVRAKSPMIGTMVAKHQCKEGDTITPELIVAYWNQRKADKTRANILLKCANCQPCDDNENFI